MKQLYLPSAGSPVIDWLIFLGFLLLVCLCLGGFVVWMKVLRSNKSKRKRRKHRHHRPTNPTLAQTGGLPPKRDPNQLPPGP
jgi:uncharacterized iron-regulated membrane protein